MVEETVHFDQVESAHHEHGSFDGVDQHYFYLQGFVWVKEWRLRMPAKTAIRRTSGVREHAFHYNSLLLTFELNLDDPNFFGLVDSIERAEPWNSEFYFHIEVPDITTLVPTSTSSASLLNWRALVKTTVRRRLTDSQAR